MNLLLGVFFLGFWSVICGLFFFWHFHPIILYPSFWNQRKKNQRHKNIKRSSQTRIKMRFLFRVYLASRVLSIFLRLPLMSAALFYVLLQYRKRQPACYHLSFQYFVLLFFFRDFSANHPFESNQSTPFMIMIMIITLSKISHPIYAVVAPRCFFRYERFV